MKQQPIEITGLMLRTSGNYPTSEAVIVELEIDGKWYEIIKEKIRSEETISIIVEPLGIRRITGENAINEFSADNDRLIEENQKLKEQIKKAIPAAAHLMEIAYNHKENTNDKRDYHV